MINSVTGPIQAYQLGFTLMHEHVMVSASGMYKSYPDLLGPNRFERAVACLKEAKAGGIDTMVDATTFDLGRDPELLCAVLASVGREHHQRSPVGGSTCRGSSAMSRPTKWRASSCATSRKVSGAPTSRRGC